jgi:tripartite ATP-independent transporter DctP family solute receptor
VQRQSIGALRIMLAVLLLLAAHLPVSVAHAEQAVLIAHMFPADSLPDKAAVALVKSLDGKSGFGKVEVAAAARLGDERENLRQLQNGEIDIAIVGDLVLDYLVPRYRLVGLPFSHRNPQEALAVYGSELGSEIRQELRKQGIEVLSWHSIGQRMLTANRPIRSLADLQGLVLRLPPAPVWIATWETLGAKPKVVPFPALHDAMRRGVVDAQENPPDFIRSKKLYEVQSHLMLTRHSVQRQFILASQRFFDALPPRQRSALRAAATTASAQTSQQAQENQAKDIAWLEREGGMHVLNLDLFAEAVAILPQVADTLDGAAGKALLTRILAAQRNAAQ